jgi:hypothetical protein
MLRRVMDVRNRIVANEYGIQLRNSLQYTAERLRDIAPGTLNERQLDNTLWKRYLYPSIDAVTQKIHALSPLEQSYFYALYNFITKELYTSKSGDVEYEGRTGASALWLATLEEKSENGEILYDLAIRQNCAADIIYCWSVHIRILILCPISGKEMPLFCMSGMSVKITLPIKWCLRGISRKFPIAISVSDSVRHNRTSGSCQWKAAMQ